MPLASPLADPAPTTLHSPTLQAIHRMQQQATPAPAMMPTLQQTPTTQPQPTLPRDPAEYTQANFPSLTPRQLAILGKHCAAAHTTSYSPVFRQWQGDLHRTRDWATHSPPAPPRALWRQDKTHSSDLDQSHTQHHEGRDRRAVCPPRIAAGAVHGHSTAAIADPGATAKTDDPAATERAPTQHPSLQIPKPPQP